MSNREQALRELVRECEDVINKLSPNPKEVTNTEMGRAQAYASIRTKLEAALAIPADAAEPREAEMLAAIKGNCEIMAQHWANIFTTVTPAPVEEAAKALTGLATSCYFASPSAVLTEEQVRELSGIDIYTEDGSSTVVEFEHAGDYVRRSEVLALLSAPAQPTAAKEGEKP